MYCYANNKCADQTARKCRLLHACVAFENLFWLSHDVAQLWSFKKLSPSSQVPLRKVQQPFIAAPIKGQYTSDNCIYRRDNKSSYDV